LRSDSSPSSPSSSGTVSGVKAQNHFNHKDVIKPDKMRECRQEKTEKDWGA